MAARLWTVCGWSALAVMLLALAPPAAAEKQAGGERIVLLEITGMT